MDIIILAAGRGERMRQAFPYPKPLVPIHGVPMIIRLIDTLFTSRLIIGRVYIVIRKDDEPLFQKEVSRYFPRISPQKIRWIHQEEKADGYGTGAGVHAVLRSGDEMSERILILNSDTPLLTARSIEGIATSGAEVSLCVGTVFLKDPRGYGRIVRSVNGTIQIVEQKEITDGHEWETINEVNTGIYVVCRDVFHQLKEITPCPVINEKKLTDICRLSRNTITYGRFSEREVLNVNSPTDRNYAEHLLMKERDDTIDRLLSTSLI